MMKLLVILVVSAMARTSVQVKRQRRTLSIHAQNRELFQGLAWLHRSNAQTLQVGLKSPQIGNSVGFIEADRGSHADHRRQHSKPKTVPIPFSGSSAQFSYVEVLKHLSFRRSRLKGVEN
jgi:hypothetical protein